MLSRSSLIRFAHRGASALAPENTFSSFQAAVELGCGWIETDVRLTSEGVPVLIHDETVDRTTGSRGTVGRMPLGQILRLDAGSWFHRKFRGERIPTLDEALEWGRGRCGLNLEIKEEKRPGEAIRQVARRLVDHDAVGRVLLSSFRSSDLLLARSLLPAVPLAWLVSRGSRGLTSLAGRAGLHALHPKDSLLTPRLAGRCRSLGLAVHVWVVNRAERLPRLEAMGVAGVMTDDPRIFASVRECDDGSRRAPCEPGRS
jgi:glycerophosphoryl diester phosphodiesterase